MSCKHEDKREHGGEDEKSYIATALEWTDTAGTSCWCRCACFDVRTETARYLLSVETHDFSVVSMLHFTSRSLQVTARNARDMNERNHE